MYCLGVHGMLTDSYYNKFLRNDVKFLRFQMVVNGQMYQGDINGNVVNAKVWLPDLSNVKFYKGPRGFEPYQFQDTFLFRLTQRQELSNCESDQPFIDNYPKGDLVGKAEKSKYFTFENKPAKLPFGVMFYLYFADIKDANKLCRFTVTFKDDSVIVYTVDANDNLYVKRLA